ncbi:MAG: hypothetical protein E6F98_04575 [Actinobacteria bacterium]|nr:MAG: hypothetical protein E6F98_04575 [Actinomycetota bacterium]
MPFGPPARTSSQQRPRVALMDVKTGPREAACFFAGFGGGRAAATVPVGACGRVAGGVVVSCVALPRRQAARPATAAPTTRTPASPAKTRRRTCRVSADGCGTNGGGSSSCRAMRALYSST